MTQLITVQWATEHNACREGIADFKSVFGERAETGVPVEEIFFHLPEHREWLAEEIHYTGTFTDENGTQYHYKNGKPHRENGPAVLYSDGKEEYWINGFFIAITTKKFTSLLVRVDMAINV